MMNKLLYLPSKIKNPKAVIGFIVILYVLSLFSHLNRIPLSFEEPRRAEVSLEMMHSGNFVVPTLNETLYFNKPPLYNWLLTGLFYLTGSTAEWVVRLPTVLSLLLIAGILFLYCRKYCGWEVAALASAMWLSSADIYYYFSLYGEIDMFYSLLVFLQALSIFHFHQQRNWLMLFMVSYFLMAMGVLTKGLPSIAFQALTLLGVAIWQRKFKWLFSWQHIAGGLTGFGLVVLYFTAYASYEDPVPFLVRLFTESTDRTLSSKGFPNNLFHLFTFPLMLLKIALPWTLFLPVILHKETRQWLKGNPWLMFSLVFFIANVAIYWISPGTRERYLYMFYPFLLSVLAAGMANQSVAWRGYLKRLHVFFTIIMVLCIAGLMVVPFLPQNSDFPSLVFVLPIIAMGMVIVCLWFVNNTGMYTRLVMIMLFMILFRWLFNFTVVPYREMRSLERKPFKENSEIVKELTGDEPVYTLAHAETKLATLGIPFYGKIEREYVEVEWPDFELSYYLARSKGMIWTYRADILPDCYYLADEQLLPSYDVHVLHTFYVAKNDKNYILFKLKSTE
ncbi:MAG: glycosyltransferase family 39 protein [Cyclobacteriaceae bacterium]|nr:glycosyltransferase family 39 protein [Cyclobacteriaceae bacterium]